MILTGKAEKDFNKWYIKNEYNCLKFSIIPKVLQHALIIKWLDSVGIYIEISKSADIFWLYGIKINNEKVYISALEPMQKTRQEAKEKAINKANEIYNETKA